jgi:phage terminase Nu1 subunit (DNA packaging protein)
MSTTRFIVAAATLAATATLTLPTIPATATQAVPDCAAVTRTSDIGEVVAFRKAQAAQYLVDHAAELARR